MRQDPKHQFYVHLTLGFTLGLEVATVMVWTVYHVYYPKAVIGQWWPYKDAERSWGVAPMEGQPSIFTYNAEKSWRTFFLCGNCGEPRRCFGYDGAKYPREGSKWAALSGQY